MQCAACRAVYSHALDACPRCQQPKTSAHGTSARASSDAAAERSAAPVANEVSNAALRADGGAVAVETAAGSAPASTLIEFPGTGRNALPQWRKELSERVREIQQRRAREAALEAEEAARRAREQALAEPFDATQGLPEESSSAKSPQLGLVPPTEAEALNPLVAAALRRIERARRPPAAPLPRAGASRTATAATAVARVAEERYELSAQPTPQTQTPPTSAPVTVAAPQGRHSVAPAANTVNTAAVTDAGVETARASSLVVVPPQADGDGAIRTTTPGDGLPAPATASTASNATPEAGAANKSTPPTGAALKDETARQAAVAPDAGAAVTPAADEKPKPRRIEGVIDETWLERRQRASEAGDAPSTGDAPTAAQTAATAEVFDDRAPRVARFAGGVVDLLVIAFLSSPFAAIIELTIGDWDDPRVWGSMAGIVLTTAFMYLTGSTALAGRTWGMSLFSLQTVDARTALSPTAGQAARRAFIYMLSLVTFGLGILYAFFDAEGRTAHDRLSGTVVVRE